jgi:hypothetical protein
MPGGVAVESGIDYAEGVVAVAGSCCMMPFALAFALDAAFGFADAALAFLGLILLALPGLTLFAALLGEALVDALDAAFVAVFLATAFVAVFLATAFVAVFLATVFLAGFFVAVFLAAMMKLLSLKVLAGQETGTWLVR